MLDPFKHIKHHRRSSRTSILEWISRTQMVYSDQNGESIYHRISSSAIILVLRGFPCSNDAQPSSGPLRPEARRTVSIFSQLKPNSKTRFELFSMVYFNHDTDNTESRSKLQAHTLDGIAVGRDDKSKYIIFCNPLVCPFNITMC